MGITGLIPFLEKVSRRANVSEFSGSTVAIDTYCWLHKGAFACADKLVRGEETDVHIKYCLKNVTMLLSKNIKPILVFDGRHLPAKAMTELKRRESRDISKKRAAELLSLGKTKEARSYMRRSVDITHAMALALIRECRKRNVDCIVAPYEADAQLAYLNVKNYAQLVITEDSDLILFGCTKVLFKMDVNGIGTLVETAKLPLVMICPIEHYKFDKFRQMCILSGCDYLASLPGIGLAKARQFVSSTQDPNFANALRKLPSHFKKLNLTVTDEYRQNFLKAEATFKHQFVYDPIERRMLRLTEPDDEDIELALCGNAGELLDPKVAFQLALGNVEPFTLKKMDDWHPDHRDVTITDIKTGSWKEKGIANHPSIWSKNFSAYLTETSPWTKKVKKVEPPVSGISVPNTWPRKKVVTLISKYVPETQDESLSIETLSNMYCNEPVNKKLKTNCDNDTQYSEINTQNEHNIATNEEEIVNNLTQRDTSPILENRHRSFKKCLQNRSNLIQKNLSRFPRTVLDENVIESQFFNSLCSNESKTEGGITVEESPEKCVNPFKGKKSLEDKLEIDTESSEVPDSFRDSQKENSLSSKKCETSPILESKCRRNPFKLMTDSLSFDTGYSESVIENTCSLEDKPVTVDAPLLHNHSSPKAASQPSLHRFRHDPNHTAARGLKKSTCRDPRLRKTSSLPSNQPTLLSKFGFQKSLSIETLNNMDCNEPVNKKLKTNCDNDTQYSEINTQNEHNIATNEEEIVNNLTQRDTSPILENRHRSFKKCLQNRSNLIQKNLSRFPRTVLDENVIESQFFNSLCSNESKTEGGITVEESPEKCVNPFKGKKSLEDKLEIDTESSEVPDSFRDSQKENSLSSKKCETSPILESKCRRNPFKLMTDSLSFDTGYSESVIENTCSLEDKPVTVDAPLLRNHSPPKAASQPSLDRFRHYPNHTAAQGLRKSTCRVPGLRKTSSLPRNQPTLLSKFGFQKRAVLKK